MRLFDVFNGDADGLCSLLQMRMAKPCDSNLITGVKRDINLLAEISSGEDSHITVFDISYDKNRDNVLKLLDEGAEIEYFDHHHAGNIRQHPNLAVHIDTTPDRGTSFIVDNYLQGRFRAWAVVGTFGDNFDETALKMAESLRNISGNDVAALRELGILLNYNAYGVTISDLLFHPADLYGYMRNFIHPEEFINSDAFNRLKAGYVSDMESAAGIAPEFESRGNQVFMLPDAPWARRVSGVFANMLARRNPDGAHAVLTGLPGKGYMVSVRAPLVDKRDAHTLCMKFPTGGGRKAAAGINKLNPDDVHRFIDEFQKTYTQK